MTNFARRGKLGAALLLAALCGFALRGCVTFDGDRSVAATVTASPTATDTSPTQGQHASPSPTPGIVAYAGIDASTADGHGGGTVADGATFGISGDVGTVLEPGLSALIELTLTNPNSRPLQIEDLTVSIGSITAPHATHAYPCTAADFSVSQVQGASWLQIPASSSASLLALGLPAPQLPRLTMLNRSTNQEGCKEATVTIVYSGTAHWADL